MLSDNGLMLPPDIRGFVRTHYVIGCLDEGDLRYTYDDYVLNSLSLDDGVIHGCVQIANESALVSPGREKNVGIMWLLFFGSSSLLVSTADLDAAGHPVLEVGGGPLGAFSSAGFTWARFVPGHPAGCEQRSRKRIDYPQGH